MEGESRMLAGEIWVATALVEEALAANVGDSDRHRAFKLAVLADWLASRIPLHAAVENDLFICLFYVFYIIVKSFFFFPFCSFPYLSLRRQTYNCTLVD